MKNIKFILLAGISLLISNISFAQGTDNSCSGDKWTDIYYVNGVWVEEDDASKVVEKIEKAYKSQAPLYNENFDFLLSYNYHVGNVRDIIETFAQKKAEIGDAGATIPYQDLILWLSADDFKKEYADYYEELYPDSNAKDLAEILEQAFLEQELLTAQLMYNMNLQELLGDYREESLEKGNRVLLMPHSQGNMYATESMKLLSGEYPTSIAMIGAANIASVKYGKTDYWTAHDDKVVNGLRRSFPVLPSNVDNDVSVINHDIAGGVYLTDPRDFANHEFIKGYFQKYISNTVTGGPILPLPSRVKIDENFVSNMQFLTHPHCTNPNSTGNGSINIAVCHNPSGNNPRTISVAPPALKAHLGHGDTIGPCF